MIVAGRLANNYTIFHKEGYTLNSYSDWLKSYVLTKEDGLWIADRRDNYPFELPEWMVEPLHLKDWPWSIQKIDFENYLGARRQWPCLFGRWQHFSSSCNESVNISSGLIDSTQSFAFVDEWLTAQDMRDYYIPYEKTEWVARKYKIESILALSNEHKGIDRFDPWAKELYFPAPAPNKNIIRKWNLISDHMGRIWKKDITAKEPIIRSASWRGINPVYSRESIEYGATLTFQKEFLFEMLGELKKDLIAKVEIYRSNDSKQSEGYNQYEYPSFRLFVFKADGTVYIP